MHIHLDHFNILVEDWDQTVKFYHQLFGFVEGKYIPKGHKNYLYTEDQTRAFIHLSSIQSKELTNSNLQKAYKIQATPFSQNKNTGAIDHIAFKISSDDFSSILHKLEVMQIKYSISHDKPRQVWFFDPNGVKLEITDKD